MKTFYAALHKTNSTLLNNDVKEYLLRRNKKRVPTLPDLSTMQESGYKNLEIGIWHGMWAPAGTPKPVTDKLVTALLAIRGLRNPALRISAQRC